MGREFELKYRATAQQIAAVYADFDGFREISMETTYYDTRDRALAPMYWTLRRRMENGISVCTLKTPCSGGGRSEWEVNAPDITAAADQLCSLGAPRELKTLIAGGVEPVCGARFTRQAVLLDIGSCTVELALDQGCLLGGEKTIPLHEVEVELKSGSEIAAVAFARVLADKYGLSPESSSKYKRALALAK